MLEENKERIVKLFTEHGGQVCLNMRSKLVRITVDDGKRVRTVYDVEER